MKGESEEQEESGENDRESKLQQCKCCVKKLCFTSYLLIN